MTPLISSTRQAHVVRQTSTTTARKPLSIYLLTSLKGSFINFKCVAGLVGISSVWKNIRPGKHTSIDMFHFYGKIFNTLARSCRIHRDLIYYIDHRQKQWTTRTIQRKTMPWCTAKMCKGSTRNSEQGVYKKKFCRAPSVPKDREARMCAMSFTVWDGTSRAGDSKNQRRAEYF